MIQVDNLVKRYGGLEAVKGITFQVKAGEIVGFLGPNGAGKSTTMRILSGYMPATSGQASIAGYDIFEQSLEVRKRIGYMPEIVPLYTDLTVNEFLTYRAELKGVRGRKIRERVAEVKHLCSLEDRGRQLIGTLSKGYRQRVGLADAMVHDPELLILDEPTIGLDPNQIRQVRTLIKNLGERHTILLSTHILSEVEMTCTRVMILHKGRIEASDTPENLTRRFHAGRAVIAELRADAETAQTTFRQLEAADDIHITPLEDGWLKCEIFAKKQEDLREIVSHTIQTQRWPLRELTRTRASLEDVFAEITHEDK